MSTITTSYSEPKLHSARPSFPGLIRGEFLKIARRWLTWLLLVPLLGAITMLHLFRVTDVGLKALVQQGQLGFYYDLATQSMSMLRVFGGIYLIILTAFVFGLEFQYGTIRILLSRGVGRVQLLLAKLLTLCIIALIIVVVGILYLGLLTILLTLIATGNLQALHVLTATFWSYMAIYISTLLLNMFVTVLMAMAMCVLTRSLAMGLTLAIIWFPIDNIGSLFFSLGYKITHNTFWLESTRYFLGPNLNAMASVILPKDLDTYVLGARPLLPVDGTHTLWIAGVYGIVFLTLSIVLTWKQDIKE